jgi:poly(3-hydroxybutyrate) depolymerase
MKLTTSLVLLASVLVCGINAATAGCGKAPSKIKNGLNTVNINGKNRQYIVKLPDNYDNTKPYRFIFGLHWRDGTMNDVANGGSIKPYYGLPQLVNNSAIFVAPDGLNRGWANNGGEDITFLQNILKTTSDDLCINENLRFSMGWSFGGAMSYSLACSLPKDIRAVAVFSGGLVSGCSGGTEPVAYYGQHGVSDSVLSISMGRQLRDTFVKNNKCAQTNPSEPGRGSRTNILTKYTGCTQGKPVWWRAFDGDHTPIPVDGGTDKERSYTGAATWEFFSQFQ